MKLSWIPFHHTAAASYIEVLSFPISKYALTGKKLSWTVWETTSLLPVTSYPPFNPYIMPVFDYKVDYCIKGH